MYYGCRRLGVPAATMQVAGAMLSACVHVRGCINLVGQRLDIHIKALLDLVENSGVLLAGYKSDGKALGAKAARAPHLHAQPRGESKLKLFCSLS